uniref:Cystatin domain-containing protein n=1 Tax=Nelumbo nucifera TaxID=4432 RepID=A0A822ZN69_NELNU|nr:TPA_asm: hypothetical protein HUJ06_003211 [Nelumbo nucifera]
MKIQSLLLFPIPLLVSFFLFDKYNKDAKTNLQFQKVVRGETQKQATDKGVTNNYEAVVWEKAWMSYRNLTSFRHV